MTVPVPTHLNLEIDTDAENTKLAHKLGFYEALSPMNDIFTSFSLPAENGILPFEDIFMSFQNAFYEYLSMSEEDFSNRMEELVVASKVSGSAIENFLNLEIEELFQVLLDQGGGELASLMQSSAMGFVESVGRNLNVDLIDLSKKFNMIDSVARDLSYTSPHQVEFVDNPLPPPIPNTPAVISGNGLAEVTEDISVLYNGVLSVYDPDIGENSFRPDSGVSDNGFGRFEITADGRWKYELNNDLIEIQKLPQSGEVEFTDSFTVYSYDGTAQKTIIVNIYGNNDAPIANPDSYNLSLTLYKTLDPQDAELHFRDFSDTSGLEFIQNAGVENTSDGTVLRLVEASVNQSGGVFSQDVINISEFSTHFSFRMTEGYDPQLGTYPGADGFMFVIHNTTIDSLSSFYTMGYEGIDNSIGIEFDTWQNFNPGLTLDPDDRHLTVNTNGSLWQTDPDYTASLPAGTAWNDEAIWNIWIDYKDGFLEIRATNDPQGIRPDIFLLRVEIDIESILGDSEGYIGFTGSTGTYYQNIDILSWTYQDTYESPVELALGVTTGNVLVNDTDIDNGAVITVGTVQGSAANVGQTILLASGALLILHADGSFTYDANNSAFLAAQVLVNGTATDTFVYQAIDEHGALSDPTTVTINLDAPINDPAVIGGDTNAYVKEDVVLVYSGVLTISDPNPGQNSFQAANGLSQNGYGSFTIDIHGAWTYTLKSVVELPEGVILMDAFIVYASDGTSQIINVEIEGTNDNPIANPDTASTLETESVLIDVLNNDTDIDSESSNFSIINASIDASSAFGGAGSVLIEGNQIRFIPDDTFRQLDEGEHATVVINYTMSDGDGGTSTSTVTVTVNGIENDLAVGQDIYLLNQGAAGALEILKITSIEDGRAELELVTTLPTTSSVGLHGDINPSGDRVYYQAGDGTRFGYYDLTTNSSTHIGSFTLGGNPIAGPFSSGAFDADGNYYVARTGTNSIYSVDLNTGALTLVGTIAGGNILGGGDLTITDSGEMYYVNVGNGNIYHLVSDGSNAFVATAINLEGGYTGLSGLADLQNGEFIISSQDADAILHYGADGNLLGEYEFYLNGLPFNHGNGDLAARSIFTLPLGVMESDADISSTAVFDVDNDEMIEQVSIISENDNLVFDIDDNQIDDQAGVTEIENVSDINENVIYHEGSYSLNTDDVALTYSDVLEETPLLNEESFSSSNDINSNNASIEAELPELASQVEFIIPNQHSDLPQEVDTQNIDSF